MNWLLNFLRSLFARRRKTVTRPQLLGMYFDESNHYGRRKSNRDRA
jgi:hypothetical protein